MCIELYHEPDTGLGTRDAMVYSTDHVVPHLKPSQ